MAQSTSEMFALMDRVATSSRTAAARAPLAHTRPRDELLAEPLDLEYEPTEDPEYDDTHEIVIDELDEAYPELDDAYAYDEAAVDNDERLAPVRLPLYPDVPEDEDPSVGDPRIDEALRRARAD